MSQGGQTPNCYLEEFRELEEKAKPEVQGFTFEVETEPEPEIRTRFLTF